MFLQVLVVFVGSTQTKDNKSLPLPDAVDGLAKKEVQVISVSIGDNFDPEDLKAIASDSKNIFPQDAIDSLKRAVKDAVVLSPQMGVFPGKISCFQRKLCTR